MALKTKTMTANEAEGLASLHRDMADSYDSSAVRGNIEETLTTLGLGILGFFNVTAGSVAAGATLLISINNRSNKSATQSYLRGAAAGFEEIAELIRDGGHTSARVEQLWISYAFGGGGGEFVQGNSQNPSQAYRIVSYN